MYVVKKIFKFNSGISIVSDGGNRKLKLNWKIKQIKQTLRGK